MLNLQETRQLPTPCKSMWEKMIFFQKQLGGRKSFVLGIKWPRFFFAGPVAFSTLGNAHELPESQFLHVKNNNNYTETSPFLFHYKGQMIYDVSEYENVRCCLCEKGFFYEEHVNMHCQNLPMAWSRFSTHFPHLNEPDSHLWLQPPSISWWLSKKYFSFRSDYLYFHIIIQVHLKSI